MAKFNTEDGEIEVALIFNNQQLTEEMKRLREVVERNLEPSLGLADKKLVGLREGPNGEWLGVFRKK